LVTLFPDVRNSASEAVVTMTNGVALRASPDYLPITVIGAVAPRDVLTINIYVLRFLNRTRWQSKELLEGDKYRGNLSFVWLPPVSQHGGCCSGFF